MKKLKVLAVIAAIGFIAASCNRVKCPSAAGSNDLPVPQEQEQKSM